MRVIIENLKVREGCDGMVRWEAEMWCHQHCRRGWLVEEEKVENDSYYEDEPDHWRLRLVFHFDDLLDAVDFKLQLSLLVPSYAKVRG